MKVSLYIAKRYLISKSSRNAINIMSRVASVGVVIATAALFVVLAGFSGLKDFSLSFTSIADPDLKILPKTGKSFVWSEADEEKLKSIYGISAFSHIIEEKVLIEVDEKSLVVNLKGVDNQYLNVIPIKDQIIKGLWVSKEGTDIVSGIGVSNILAFGVFDFLKPINIYVPKPGVGQGLTLKSYYNSTLAYNVGLFAISQEIDDKYIFSHLKLARKLLNYKDNEFSSIELGINNADDESKIKKLIEQSFPNRFEVKNRTELNSALHKMLNSENLVVYLICTLVVIMALFNISGALIMMILDKKSSLETLYNYGMSLKEIKKIFFYQGFLMTVYSTLIGLTIGFILVGIQLVFEPLMINSTFAYPMNITVLNTIIVCVTILSLGFLASKIASYRIKKSLFR